MAVTTKLSSRFPMIEAEIRTRVSGALKEGAEAIAEEAKIRVPKDTEDLYQAIHVEREGPASYSVVAGDDTAFYGHIVEHGSTKQAPRPFLVPAVDAQEDTAVNLVLLALTGL